MVVLLRILPLGVMEPKILGACYCEAVMPLTEPLIDAESESWNKVAY